MDSFPDYYTALGVAPAATQQEISRAYRALMRTHHPDVDGGAAAGGAPADQALQDAELLKIMQAFAVLRDPQQRAAYDHSISGRIPDGAAPQNIPVRKVRRPAGPARHTIRITPVRWESGPWA
ncbi:J domain-containing protein [Arthrobacter sp. ISL-48]|uniref:J domain-containing protein n=1 Tax=Arthrobacter sp. ISL-48 TaxID=2819110 RepID=UPI001BE7950B|nr:J domain-containing protein [Arthrobacter sp. ISL-48]MBT2532273.1 J domain-containing protein [Arthrobacter sp. ISL-48]